MIRKFIKCRSFITAILTLFFMDIQAQNTCKNVIYDANKLYENGRINHCITLLKNGAGNMPADKAVEAYHLLGLAYLAQNDPENARECVKKFLNLRPDYQKFPNPDPPPCARLVNEFTISPKKCIGFAAGKSPDYLPFSYNIYTNK